MRTLCLVLALFALGSCSDEDATRRFVMNIAGPGDYGNVLILSDDPGTIYYEGNAKNGTVEVNVSPETSVLNLTYGMLGSDINYLTTLRGIPSGYTFTQNSGCYDDFRDFLSNQYNFELVIQGISSYQQIFFNSIFEREIIPGADQIILKGKLIDRNTEIFSILPIGESEFKSIVVDFEDWTLSGSQAYLEKGFNEFVVLPHTDIGVGETGSLSSYVYGKDSNGKNYNLSTSFTHQSLYDDKIRIIEPTPLEKYLISIYVNTPNNGHYNHKRYSMIPSEVELYKPVVTVSSLMPEAFVIDPIDEVELIYVNMNFGPIQGPSFNWNVWQLPEAGLDYNLHVLSEEIISSTGFNEELLQHLNQARVTSYKDFDSNIGNEYRSEPIDWECAQYSRNVQNFPY